MKKLAGLVLGFLTVGCATNELVTTKSEWFSTVHNAVNSTLDLKGLNSRNYKVIQYSDAKSSDGMGYVEIDVFENWKYLDDTSERKCYKLIFGWEKDDYSWWLFEKSFAEIECPQVIKQQPAIRDSESKTP